MDERLRVLLGWFYPDRRHLLAVAHLPPADFLAKARKQWIRRRLILSRYARLDVLSPGYADLTVQELNEYAAETLEILEGERGPMQPAIEDGDT